MDEKVIRNRSWEGHWEVWEGSWSSLGGLWDLGGVLEVLGGSMDRFLEALGRIWGGKMSEV